jgi:Uma2 family endonuclease
MTADTYQEIGRAGLFDPTLRLELLDGEIYEMSPIGSRHAACVDRLSNLLNRLVGRSFIVRTQNPIRLSDLSEPVPDLSLADWRDDFYEKALPIANAVHLVIEVADTSLRTDRLIKTNLYAVAGIPETWVVDLLAQKIEVFTVPVKGTYSELATFTRGQVIRSTTITGLEITVEQILGANS